MKFYCIGDEDAVRGFRLAGVGGQVALDAAQAEAALAAAAAMEDCGVVLITRAAAALARKKTDELRAGSARPLIVEI